MKTNKTTLLPTYKDINEKDNKILDSITKLTNEQTRKELTHYAYSITATIKDVSNRSSAKVEFSIEGIKYTYDAFTTQPLKETDKTKECLVIFNQGKVNKPIITGIIQTQESEPLVLSCEDGIILECGDTRIELDIDGTLDLKAQHINSQAYGPYRIKGGSVKIN